MRTEVTSTSTPSRQTGVLTSHPARGLEELHSRPRMQAILERERARTDRSGGLFSVVLFRVKDHDPRTLSTARLLRALLARVRFTDEVGWFSDRFVCAVLPDTPAKGAWRLAEDVCDRIADKAPRPICLVYTYPSQQLPEAGDGQEPGRDQVDPPASPGGGDRLGKTSNHGNGSNHARGNGHATGNGHGNGNGNGRDASHPGLHSSRIACPTPGPASEAAAHATLLGHLAEGAAAELGSQPLEQFLAYPLPGWKRLLDLAVSSILLLLLSPLMLAAAIAVKLSSPGPVLFRQRRAGLGGRPFTIYKFRTMTTDAEARKQELRQYSEQDGPAFKMRRDPRVTPLGRILRTTSIDELPQLWNVLKGQMSLVGPRPMAWDEYVQIERWHRRRLAVTPGITCIWQVKGRSRVTFAEWMRMDMQYIRRRSLLMDLKLLCLTVPAVLLSRGAH